MPENITRALKETFVACPKCSGMVLEKKKYFRARSDTATGRPVEHHSMEIYVCTNCGAPILEKEPTDPIHKSIIAELWPQTSIKDLTFIEKKLDINSLNLKGKTQLSRNSMGTITQHSKEITKKE